MNTVQLLRSHFFFLLLCGVLVGFSPAMFAQSVVSNPGFESGTSPWQFYSNGSASFAVDVAGASSPHAGHITIQSAGSNVQLYQTGFPVQANTRYSLTFKAYSNTGHDLSVSLHKHTSPYSNFGFDQVFDLTTSWSTFSVQFTTTGFSGTITDARLRFWLAAYGAANDQYFIDDVVLASAASGGSGPEITSQPVGQNVMVGQAATFSIEASGSAPLGFQWKKNDVVIAGATATTFTTPPASTGDNGSTFLCIVSNSFGTVTSNAATLTVSSTSTGQTPYLGVPFAVPGLIQIEDFDNGGEGVAYHDFDEANQGGQYRATAGVDIEAVSDAGGGYNVGYVRAGEWLEYTVSVPSAGTYTLDVRVAASGSGGTFHIEFGGVDKTGLISVPNTGNWQAWQTISKAGVVLSAGQQILRVVMDSDGSSGSVGNFNFINIGSGGSAGPPVINSHPASQTVVAGQTATFSISASGGSPLSFQWQKNTVNIAGASNSSYTTPSVTSADNGAGFRCIVSNSGGSTTSNTAILSVQGGSPITLSFTQRVIDNDNPRNPHCKAIGDINGDGYIDVLAASSSGFTEGLFWYKYPTWTKYNIHQGSFSTSMQVADIDRDGDLDAVIPKGNDYGASVWVYINPRPSGNPESGPWQEIYVGDAGAHDVEIGDMNGDGKLDIVVRLSTSITIFYQNSTTSWTKTVLNTRSFEGTSLGDLDGDGDLDIAINGYWLENPTWTEHTVNANWGSQLSVHIADVNNDGRQDILFAPSEYTGGLLAWYESSSPRTGPWTEHVIATDMGYIHSLKTADMDNDGDVDVVAAEMHQSNDPDEVAVYRNSGGGLSWNKVVVATTGSHNARLGDIGNDGDIDIIGANWNDSAPNGAPLEYWENLGGGGGGSSLDLWTYIQADNSRAPSIFGNGAFGLDFADVNGDGYKDIASGRYFYRNPGGNITSSPWPRVTLPNSPQSGRAVDAFLLFDAEGTGVKNDIIAEDLPNVTWLRANDTQGNSWSATVVAQIPVTSHGNGRTVKSARIIASNAKPDILLTGGDGIYLMQIPSNPSSGNWPIMRITTSSNGEQKAIGVGDINRDGHLDIAAAKGADQLEVDWWSNPGNGTNAWVRRVIGNTNATSKMIEVADINGDGRLDVIVTEEARPASVYWFEAPSDPVSGTWTRHTVATGLEELDSMSGMDVNNDGKPDIVVGEIFGSQRVIIFENVNNGASWASHVVGSGKESHNGARTVDLNNDGLLDIVSIAYNSYGYLHVWRNDGASASPGVPASTSMTQNVSSTALPTEFALHRNYPNPFNPSTTIRYDIPKNTHVRLAVFDMLGKKVAQLIDEVQAAGVYDVRWNGANMASGTYICRIETQEYTRSIKLILMK